MIASSIRRSKNSANHELPCKVFTENGTSFMNEEFKSFMSDNGIVHVTSALYHPSSKNGLFKHLRTVWSVPAEPLFRNVFVHLLYHSSNHSRCFWCTTSHRPISRLNRLFPDISQRVKKQQSKQAEQAEQCDNTKSPRTFKVGDSVYVKDFSTP